MMMSVEQSVEWELAGETEVLGENLPQRHFVHHKSHMNWRGLETRAAALGSRRLTAWAMARPNVSL
jgi:phage-related protein